MQFRTTGLLLLGAMALPASGSAQTTAAPPAITRTVIAATKLPTVTDVPLHFKAVSITLQPDEKSGVSAANGILYQMSGSTEVALDGEVNMLNAGSSASYGWSKVTLASAVDVWSSPPARTRISCYGNFDVCSCLCLNSGHSSRRHLGPPSARQATSPPVYSITLPTIAGDHEGSFMPNVLAVLPRRFSLSVPLWLPWTIVHLKRGS